MLLPWEEATLAGVVRTQFVTIPHARQDVLLPSEEGVGGGGEVVKTLFCSDSKIY